MGGIAGRGKIKMASASAPSVDEPATASFYSEKTRMKKLMMMMMMMMKMIIITEKPFTSK